MEVLFIIFVAAAVVALTAVAFCVWSVAAVVKAIVRAVRPARPVARGGADRQTCANGDCRCVSPVHARFCRRCGRPLPSLMRLAKARAA